jgi:hypothetical protein
VPRSLAGESVGAEYLVTPQPLPDAIASAAKRVIADIQGDKPLPIALAYMPCSEDMNFGTLVVNVGGERYGFGVDSGASETEIVRALAEGVQEHLSETALSWGQARPVCPGHPHPAIAHVDGGDAVWACPRDGRRLGVVGEFH